MKLFKSYLEEAIRDFKDDDIVVRFIGDKNGFSPELRELMDENEECSRERQGMVLNIAMNYGSRDEIVRAVRAIAADVRDGRLSEDEITEQLVSDHLPVSPIRISSSVPAASTAFPISCSGSRLTPSLSS